MTTPALQSEYIVRALEAEIAARFRSCLDAVQINWQAIGHPMALPSPVVVSRGFIESIARLDKNAFPRVTIIGAPLAPARGGDMDRIVDAIHTIVLEWHVLAPTASDATTMNWRYGEAMNGLIMSTLNFAKWSPVSMIPTISEGQPMIHVGSGASKPSGWWICGSIATWPMRGRYTR